MSENKTRKVPKGTLKKKKKSRTNREGSTEPAGTSLEPSTLGFEGAGASEENNRSIY